MHAEGAERLPIPTTRDSMRDRLDNAGAVGMKCRTNGRAMKVSLIILGEPASKANQRKIVTFGKGDNKRAAIIKSEKARNYEAAAAKQIPPDARVMFTGPVRVTLQIFYATERPDLDESVILDVLQAKYRKGTKELERAGVYVNDRQVREKHVYHAIDRDNPRAAIVVESLVPQQPSLELLPPPIKNSLRVLTRIRSDARPLLAILGYGTFLACDTAIEAIGYGTFLYGHEAAGCVMLGLAGALWAEERRRLTNPRSDREHDAVVDPHSINGG
jgi:Holliday junction resolvase RusA-like endonuclease